MSKDTNSLTSPVKRKQPKVRFNLKPSSRGEREVRIMAILNYKQDGKNQRIVYSTGQRVDPKFWNKKEQRVKESLSYVDHDNRAKGTTINRELEKISDSFINVNTDLFKDRPIDKIIFKEELDIRLERKTRPKRNDTPSFLKFIELQRDKHKIRVNGLRGGQTWQKYDSMIKRLQDFKTSTGFDLDYENINEYFKDEFVLYLEKKELSQNTISKDIATLKQLLKISRKYHSNKYYNDPDFIVDRIKTTLNYPTLDELKHLYNFDFENDKLRRVSDLFLISAFGGGLRISDIQRLSKENLEIIDDQEVLRVYTYKGRNTKSDNEVVIPVTPQLKEIINRYDWDFPKYSEQEINRSLKDAFAEAELDRAKLIKSGVKGKQAEQKRLCDTIHFHNARSAYIDYMMNDLDVSAEHLRKITGQSLKILLGYERGDKGKNAVKVAEKINAKLMGMHVASKNEAV